MGGTNRWTGWIIFAGWLLIIIGALDFFEGLIAIIRGQYYVLSPTQVIVFDTTTWGWLTLLWGIVLAFAGFGLIAGATWARFFAIVAGTINLIGQLGFVGSATYPLWALAVLTLTVIVLYGLIVHWDEARPL
jgi:hypothetical protein